MDGVWSRISTCKYLKPLGFAGGVLLAAILIRLGIPSYIAGATSVESKISAPSTSVSVGLSDGVVNVDPDYDGSTTSITIKPDTNDDLKFGYSLTLQGTADTNDLIDATGHKIAATPYSWDNANELPANTWGIFKTKEMYARVPSKNEAPLVLASSTDALSTSGESTDVTYAVNLNDTSLPAGIYTTEVQYTVTANIPPAPTVESLSPNTETIGSQQTITANGTSMDSVTDVWFDLNKDGVMQDSEKASNVKATDDHTLSFVLPVTTVGTIAPGEYDVTFVGIGGSSTPVKFSYKYPNTCTSGDQYSSCSVTLDENMIPMRYISNNGGYWKIVRNSEMSMRGYWYDYGQKQWANAFTVRADKSKGSYTFNADGTIGRCSDDKCQLSPLEAAKYYMSIAQDNTEAYINFWNLISQNDILGYWTYIPRYAYNVMRRDVNDKVVEPRDFRIMFEKKDAPKKVPAQCTKSNSTTHVDYQSCGLSTEYGSATGTTWATHPAFTWGDQELDGIWVGKFNNTGTRAAPTVLPGVLSQRETEVGLEFTSAASIGVSKPNYGETVTGITQNSHSLKSYNSHMMKNSEWGAVAYLSASKYGAGYDGVKSPNITSTANLYTGGGAGEAYESNVTQSTTGNQTGIYDMVGGAWDYVMGSYSRSSSETNSTPNTYGTPIKPPYVDLYYSGVFSNNESGTNFNQCTWETCGGHALHEVTVFQTAGTEGEANYMWNKGGANFVRYDRPWFMRGGYMDGSSGGDNIFTTNYSYGNGTDGYAFFSVLAPTAN